METNQVRTDRPKVGFRRDGTPQARGNQWTKLREVKERLTAGDERERDRLRAEYAAGLLEAHVRGKHKMSATAVQAAKILVDKGKPSLQAVEQTVLEAAVTRSEPELLAALRDLMLAHPDLVQQILGEQARSSSQPVAAQPTGVQPQQSEESAA